MTLATVDIVRRTGSSGAIVDTPITSGSTRASTSDDPAPGTNNAIPIPGAGSNYSYWVTTRLKVTANPDGNTVNNLKWYPQTSNVPSGVTMYGAIANVSTDAGYRIATGTLGTSGNLLNGTNHPGLAEATADLFGFSSASMKSLTGTTSTTGLVGDHWVYQVAVDSTVSPVSPAPANTFVWRYDEA